MNHKLSRITMILLCAIALVGVACNNRDGGFYGSIMCYGENDLSKFPAGSILQQLALQATGGAALPPSAIEIYFCECMDRDATKFLIFRCTKSDLESFVDELFGERLEDLPTEPSPTNLLIFQNLRVVPERMRKVVDEANQVKNARYFNDRFGHYVVIDTERSRVFLHR